MKFVSIMLPGFRIKLDLPPDFCAQERGVLAGKSVVVETCLRKWKIQVGKEGGTLFLHGDEWLNFVNEHQLEDGSIVVFEHRASFHFRASIFDASSCEKLQFHSNASRAPPPSRNPSFSTTLTTTSGYNTKATPVFFLPVNIWKPYNLHRKSGAIIKLWGSESKEWAVKLRFYSGPQPRLAVLGGWSNFVWENKLVDGCKCKFEIIVDASGFGYSDDLAIINVKRLR